jgi:hypothetical protein
VMSRSLRGRAGIDGRGRRGGGGEGMVKHEVKH